MKNMRSTRPVLCLLVCLFYSAISQATQAVPAAWFETFKQQASDEQLYQFLFLLPKGGDLHHHLGGANFSEWWFELATDQQRNGGYQYFTQLYPKNCQPAESQEYQPGLGFFAFRTIQSSHYQSLNDCDKSRYQAMEKLTPAEKQGWLNSLRLDKTGEGRTEFFEQHWSRINELSNNPYLMAEMLVKNMHAFAREGLVYLESQAGAAGFMDKLGQPLSEDQVALIFSQRLARQDAKNTGVTTRLQYTLLRFTPNAEQRLEDIYHFVDQHRELYVGINFAGREDNDKGYPLRFLATLRKLRSNIPGINLSIHGGEVDEPNFHVRDTLLLGASRIGHGINLIDDPQTMLLMRNGQAMVEINLISNLLLEYISNYQQHPFPEYLRTGIPVALSTDDRGMWDSTMTDEYFVAVKEFNLSWQELILLGENSLRYSFVDEQTKQMLLSRYQQRIDRFRQAFGKQGTELLNQVKAEKHGFICQHYQLCQP